MFSGSNKRLKNTDNGEASCTPTSPSAGPAEAAVAVDTATSQLPNEPFQPKASEVVTLKLKTRRQELCIFRNRGS